MTTDVPLGELETLTSIRDWLRWAASRFNAAQIAYGHGTTNALDEAAFLILKTLHLPVDQLEPWLDARLTFAERAAVRDIIERRIATRTPAPYLVNEAWIGGHRFWIDDRAIVPRSYIGELLRDGLSPVVGPSDRIGRALDLCTGSGCLAILVAIAFPDTQIDAVDISADALAVAARNVEDYELQSRVALHRGDLFAPLETCKYDLIIANPPYVGAAAMAAFPPEHRAEPAIAHDGGPDGLALVHRILRRARRHLTARGHLVVEIGTAKRLLESAYPELPFVWLDTEESEGEVFWLQAADLHS